MKYVLFLLLAAASVSPGLSAETLHYLVNWPSGLSLGEATLTSNGWSGGSGAEAQSQRWEFNFTVDASIPGFAIKDHYHSKAAGSGICSSVLEKTASRGSRHSEETDTFDQDQHRVTRESHAGGGKSEYTVPDCARDALSFIQFVRDELAHGRLAPQQPVVLGAAYDVRLEFAGTQTVKMIDKPVEADRIRATIKGPASNLTVEILFAHDAARTPVSARIPLPLGAFTVELTH
ncbi:MAG TPA: DUF3108 domain-containing protein [Bryobacteraceae bacterium]|nr:DUF3108 domain-containing protein [Bryobacteraceae bacterium]